MDPTATGCVCIGIEARAEQCQPLRDCRPDWRLVFADTSGEDDAVQSAQIHRAGADSGRDALDEHLDRRAHCIAAAGQQLPSDQVR